MELILDSQPTYQINAKTEPEASKGWTLVYSSSDPDVVTVDQDGMLLAVREGTAIITIQAENTDVVKEIEVQVNPPAAKKLTLELNEITASTTGYQVNDQYSFQILGNEGVPMNPQLFQITSSDSDVIHIDEDTGIISLLKTGSATIDVTYIGSKQLTLSQKITVVAERAGSMELAYRLNDVLNQQPILEMNTADLKNASFQLTPRILNERGTAMENGTFTFKSNNTAVAKVDKNGVITGTGKEGIAVITATEKSSALTTELTLYVYDTGAPLLAADSKIALNIHMTPNHPDAPVVQLQSILSNYISSVDGSLYQLEGKDNYVPTGIAVRNMGQDGSGLYTLILGCYNNPGMLKSGNYYLRVLSNGQYYYIKLSLSITNKMPAVKVTADSFNVFLLNSRGKLNVTTNEKVSRISITEVADVKGKQTGAFDWYSSWNSQLQAYEYYVHATSTLTNNIRSMALSKFNTKYTAEVTLENYNTPATVALTIPATYTVPKVTVTPGTVYASDNGYVYADLEVAATIGKEKPELVSPYYNVSFADYNAYISSYNGNRVTLVCPALAKGSVSGTLHVEGDNNWLFSVPVKLTITAQNLAKNCKINKFAVNAITKETATQQVLLNGKQVLKMQSATLVNDDLFQITCNQYGIHVTPTAESAAYKSSKYQYTVTMFTQGGEQLKDVNLTVQVSKTVPKVTAPSTLYLNGTQRGRQVKAALTGLKDWSMLDVAATTIVVKNGSNLSSDIAVAYDGEGVFTITNQQKCSGKKYTVEITPVLKSGEKLKLVKIQVTGTTNPIVTAKVAGKLDMRKHLTSETAVALTMKNTSATVESISIINGFSSIFEIRSTNLTAKNPQISVALKDGMDIPGGVHALPLKVTLSDGTVLDVSTNVTVTCSKVTVDLPTINVAHSAKYQAVSKTLNAELPDNASITAITNADTKSPFKVSYHDGVLTVYAEKRAEIRKGIYTVNCLIYASNDLVDGTGTPCKLKVVVR